MINFILFNDKSVLATTKTLSFFREDTSPRLLCSVGGDEVEIEHINRAVKLERELNRPIRMAGHSSIKTENLTPAKSILISNEDYCKLVSPTFEGQTRVVDNHYTMYFSVGTILFRTRHRLV